MDLLQECILQLFVLLFAEPREVVHVGVDWG